MMIRLYTQLLFLSFLLLFRPFAFAQQSGQPEDLFDSMLTGDFSGLAAKNTLQPFGENETVNKQRLRVAKNLGNHKGAAVAANNLGWIELNRKNYDEALRYFTLAQEEFRKGKAYKGEAGAQAEVALVYRLSGDLDKSIAGYEQALAKMKALDMKRGTAAGTLALGQLYSIKKEHQKAIRSLTESNDTYKKLGDKKGISETQIQLAEEFIASGNETQALPLLENAVQIKKELKDPGGQSRALRDIGIIHFRKNDYEKALEYFQSSLKLKEDLQVLKLVRDTYLKLFAESRVNVEPEKEQLFNKQYQKYKDTIQSLLNSRALSPDSLSKEVEEKEKIAGLVHTTKEKYIKALDADAIEANRKITDAELERLRTEAAIEELSKEKRQDELEDKERRDQIAQLQKDKAAQDLALSQKQLEQARQQVVIYALLALAIVILTSLAFVYWRYLSNKKSHVALDKAYAELRTAHLKLKNMQTQLVHSEKMASLGQLTAGIAHEIQNPLNFVNNFSELSNELIGEIKNASTEQERNEILGELKNNLDKINHHGKRADSIVKNMLQHSRAGKNEKTPVDINKLCEEYLTLSYHGMRASDSSFNCCMEKQLDDSIGKVKIIHQDISRVLLNLFNNALYAVRARKNANGVENYTPTVSVITQMLNHSILIRVRDNGTGIPEDVKEKIFTPFFTTKPTGEGTGLGLSLSHDIIKAHGGEIRVNPETTEGTEFLIRLPAK